MENGEGKLVKTAGETTTVSGMEKDRTWDVVPNADRGSSKKFQKTTTAKTEKTNTGHGTTAGNEASHDLHASGDQQLSSKHGHRTRQKRNLEENTGHGTTAGNESANDLHASGDNPASNKRGPRPPKETNTRHGMAVDTNTHKSPINPHTSREDRLNHKSYFDKQAHRNPQIEHDDAENFNSGARDRHAQQNGTNEYSNNNAKNRHRNKAKQVDEALGRTSAAGHRSREDDMSSTPSDKAEETNAADLPAGTKQENKHENEPHPSRKHESHH